jgi:pimeloyl-ACP methyl ester carboxylesterase
MTRREPHRDPAASGRRRSPARVGPVRRLPHLCVLGVGLLVAALLAACTGGEAPAADRDRPPTPGTVGRLADRAPCPTDPGFTCATLTVPLDHRLKRTGPPQAPVADRIGLRVAVADNADAPRGVLLFLTGGPGQPGLPHLGRVREAMAPVLRDYRLVMIDQRGTGPNALDCPQLQDQLGYSDLATPTAAAVRACAAGIGEDRRFYATADTVADLELLRQALGVRTWTLDGVSYGTLTAERYAQTHPDRVARLVLDSVVPAEGVEPLLRVPFTATGRVLRAVCRAESCRGDPAADLAALVRAHPDLAMPLLDALGLQSVVDPTYPGVLAELHDAASGDVDGLRSLLRDTEQSSDAPAEELSQGLHASTLCLDVRWPWGDTSAPAEGRDAAVDRAVAGLGERDVWPFDPATAGEHGYMLTCKLWPPTPAPAAPPAAALPDVPVLLLAGDRDLSTPKEWAETQAAHTPDPTLVVLTGEGHGVQIRARSDAGRTAAVEFLRAP